jgi:hypothetical protein
MRKFFEVLYCVRYIWYLRFPRFCLLDRRTYDVINLMTSYIFGTWNVNGKNVTSGRVAEFSHVIQTCNVFEKFIYDF